MPPLTAALAAVMSCKGVTATDCPKPMRARSTRLTLLSAIKNVKVRGDLAMTGEVTLRGNVLPIGGLKEKALAAYRVGVKDVIIPADNKKDLEEIPENIREKLHFIPVTDVDAVFKSAIIGI